MADEHPTEPLPAEPAEQPAAAPQRPARQRLRDRSWPFWSLVGTALVAVLVGGIAGMALANVTNDRGHDRFGPGMMGRYQRFERGGPMMPPGYGGFRHRYGHRFGHRFGQGFGPGSGQGFGQQAPTPTPAPSPSPR